ncbi:dual specificity phosphatase 29 isoform X2 [Hyalella azteca]|nr:dual specificity phosphatase 29 isoform X2 [Hyalella azteca]XP_047735672.1 dual specificity phosphatase 29 isoform X2 [Hyalella azteca]
MRGHISRFVDGADMDEVYPHIFLGDCDAAMNKQYLLRSGVTHVLNAAANLKMGPAPVKTGDEFYKDTPLIYKGLDLIDLPFANAAKHFEAAAEFIDGALNSGGTVLVHCRQGRSRSASVLAAFLMTRRGYTAARALRQLKQSRDIRPNNGFLAQLAALDLQLFRERLERIRLEPSSSSSSESDSESNSVSKTATLKQKSSSPELEMTTKSPKPQSKTRQSSTESDKSQICSDESKKNDTKEDSPKSSDNDSIEYHSAVSSVCSTSISNAFENANPRSVSITVHVSLKRRQSPNNETEQYVSQCVRVQSVESLESDNDADDESSDSES